MSATGIFMKRRIEEEERHLVARRIYSVEIKIYSHEELVSNELCYSVALEVYRNTERSSARSHSHYSMGNSSQSGERGIPITSIEEALAKLSSLTVEELTNSPVDELLLHRIHFTSDIAEGLEAMWRKSGIRVRSLVLDDCEFPDQEKTAKALQVLGPSKLKYERDMFSSEQSLQIFRNPSICEMISTLDHFEGRRKSHPTQQMAANVSITLNKFPETFINDGDLITPIRTVQEAMRAYWYNDWKPVVAQFILEGQYNEVRAVAIVIGLPCLICRIGNRRGILYVNPAGVTMFLKQNHPDVVPGGYVEPMWEMRPVSRSYWFRTMIAWNRFWDGFGRFCKRYTDSQW